MKLNKEIPEYLLGKYQLIGTVTFIALFAVVFLNIYIPYSQTAWFGLANSSSTTFIKTLLFVGVSLIILIGSRMMMYQSKYIFKLTFLTYILWCICESAAIAGLYTWITNSIENAILGTSNELFYKAFMYGSIALGVPNIIAGMWLSIIDKNNTIKLMSYENVVTEDSVIEGPLKKITLFDNSGALKLSLNIESLYYIESDDNYIKVWYTDNKGELRQYMLRCRLKTVEESFKGSSLVRCNRKYIVNIDKVKVLRKESDAYVLDLDNEAIPSLPITKTYTDIVLAHFTEQQPLLDPLEE